MEIVRAQPRGGRSVEALDGGVPRPAALQETLRSVFEHDLVALLDVNLHERRLSDGNRHAWDNLTYGLIRDLLTQRWDDLWVKRLLNELGELLNRTLKIPTKHDECK